MSSTFDYVQYVCDQLRGAGEITYKKMFGEYGVYCNGKIIGVVCDNQLFVKKTDAGALVYPDCEEAAPYPGATPHFLCGNLEDCGLMTVFISETCRALPEPKPKKKKQLS